MRAAVEADGRVLDGRQRGLVERPDRQERNGAGEPGLRVLARQGDTRAARHEDEDRVRLQRTDARQLGREVELVLLDVDLVEHFALEVVLEARGGIASALVVGHQRDDSSIAAVLGVFADRLRYLVVLPRGREEEWIALLAGKHRGPGIHADEEGPALGDRLERRLQNVGGKHADNEIDLVALDELLGSQQRHVRFDRVILDDHFGIDPAELAAALLDGEQEAIARVLAERREGAGQCGEEADLERLCLGRDGACQEDGHSHGCGAGFHHAFSEPVERSSAAFRCL